MTERFSIITISYNSASTIENTFQSILSQSYRPLEYVVIDGGSTDGTAGLMDQYRPVFSDAGIEVCFSSEPDNGISDAFNKGINRATGSVIGIINADDCLAENALHYVADAFAEQTDVLCGDCLWIDREHNLRYVRKSTLNLKKLRNEMVLMHPTCFVRKKAYEAYGLFDTGLRYVMDHDLMARFNQSGAVFQYIPHTLAIMSAGGVSDSNENTDRILQEDVIVAVRNGVPRWKAALWLRYQTIRLRLIRWMKSRKHFRKYWER